MVVAPDAVKMDASDLNKVKVLFEEQINQGLHPGGLLAVYRHGNLVLDLHGGIASQESLTPVETDSMFVLFSSTKAMTAACVHLLWERGKLSWDDRVAQHWPGFAKNNKDQITIRHILSHQGGFPETPSELTWRKWLDWEAVVTAMENITPEFAPGQVMAYHPRNYGWMIGELVRRIDGRPFNEFLRDEITGPLGMDDTYVGMPEEFEPRVAKLHAMEDCDRPGMVTTYNQPGVHQAVQPAGGGIATARDLARFYAMMGAGCTLDGVQIMKPSTIKEVTKLQVEGLDHTLVQHMRRSLGLVLADKRMGASDWKGSQTFGHGGAGTSIGWADPESGLAVAFITNGFRSHKTNNPRLEAISRAVRKACR